LDLFSRQRAGELNAHIRVIVSNHWDLEPVASQFGVAYRHSAITPQNQAAQEKEQLAAMREHGIELMVLARYMRILGPELVDARFRSGSSTSTTPFFPLSRAPVPISARMSGA